MLKFYDLGNERKRGFKWNKLKLKTFTSETLGIIRISY